MNMKKKLLPVLVSAAITVPAMMVTTAANAELSANVAMTTDYVWRGISQSASDPAIQGGFDFAHNSGFYAGVWGSNVDWNDPDTAGSPGNGEDLEVDIYGGYGGELGNGIGYDVGVIKYIYPGALADVDFTEVYIGASYGMFSAKYSYSDDFGNAGPSAYYVEAGLDYELPQGINLALHVGKSDGDAFAAGSDYIDYSIGISKEIGGFGLDLTYWDTDASGANKTTSGALQNDGAVIFTVSKSL